MKQLHTWSGLPSITYFVVMILLIIVDGDTIILDWFRGATKTTHNTTEFLSSVFLHGNNNKKFSLFPLFSSLKKEKKKNNPLHKPSQQALSTIYDQKEGREREKQRLQSQHTHYFGPSFLSIFVGIFPLFRWMKLIKLQQPKDHTQGLVKFDISRKVSKFKYPPIIQLLLKLSDKAKSKTVIL